MLCRSAGWLLSAHFWPLGAGILLAALVMLLEPSYTAWALVFLLMGSTGTLFFIVFLPLAPLKCEGPHHVGIRHITATLAVYYPTFIKPIEGEPWLPGDNPCHVKTLAALLGVSSFWLRHLKYVRIPCTRNASIVSLMTHRGEPRKVCILSHNVGVHHLAYSRLALGLASCGAVVYSIHHGADMGASDENIKCGFGTAEEERLREGRNSYEQQLNQVSKRVEEVVHVIDGICSGELLQHLQVRLGECQSFLSSKPKVNLVGHGLGAVTMLAVAMKDKAHASRIGCITALDMWTKGVLDNFARGQQLLLSHISVQFLDSEEWYQSPERNAAIDEVKELLETSGASCIYRTHPGTDRKSITDMGLLTPLTKRRSFASRNSSTYIPLVAKEILIFSDGQPDVM